MLGMLASSLVAYLLLRTSQKQTNRAWDRGDALAKRLDTLTEDHAQLEAQTARDAAIYKTNAAELKRELADKQAQLAELGARLDSVQKARDDFANVLQSDPRLVTAAVSTAFDRLRQELSRAQEAAAAAAARDSRGGEAGPVHAKPDDNHAG